MKKSNIQGLIFEGIAGTGKTTTLTALLSTDQCRKQHALSSIVLSEHHTMRVLENKYLAGTLSTKDSVDLLDMHTTYLENLQTNLTQTGWLECDRIAQKIPFILERFHLTHAYHYDTVSWNDVAGIDERLSRLNTKLCVFTIDPEDIQERIIEDYKKSGWQDYLKTLGSTDTEITDHFVLQQQKILQLAEKTTLPVRLLDASRLTTDQLAKEILEYWNSSGTSLS